MVEDNLILSIQETFSHFWFNIESLEKPLNQFNTFFLSSSEGCLRLTSLLRICFIVSLGLSKRVIYYPRTGGRYGPQLEHISVLASSKMNHPSSSIIALFIENSTFLFVNWSLCSCKSFSILLKLTPMSVQFCCLTIKIFWTLASQSTCIKKKKKRKMWKFPAQIDCMMGSCL